MNFEKSDGTSRFRYPRPLSEPPSPSSTPAASELGSDSEEDEKELEELGIK